MFEELVNVLNELIEKYDISEEDSVKLSDIVNKIYDADEPIEEPEVEDENPDED